MYKFNIHIFLGKRRRAVSSRHLKYFTSNISRLFCFTSIEIDLFNFNKESKNVERESNFQSSSPNLSFLRIITSTIWSLAHL